MKLFIDETSAGSGKKTTQMQHISMVVYNLANCDQRGIALKNQFVCQFVQPYRNDIALGKIALQ